MTDWYKPLPPTPHFKHPIIPINFNANTKKL